MTRRRSPPAQSHIDATASTSRTMLTALRARSLELWRAGPAVQYCRDIGISSREGLWGAFTGEEPNLGILREWIPGYRVDAWTGALAQFGIDDAALASELADFFLADRRQRHVVFPESRPTLEALRPRVKIGMITNGAPDIQRAKIDGSGFAGYFDTVLVSGEEGFGKPKPEIFRLAIDRLGVDEASTGDDRRQPRARYRGRRRRRHQERLGEPDRYQAKR